ncbi:MAG TPA: YggT family protein [Syntrophomonadaceae bacterium]|nr:YggT family protein [Syntrophomonadaceae bacterium]HQE22564.1 YggT family protein [Syntrophomonadaceae bacterium]
MFVIQVVNTAFNVLIWLIVGRCILSFIPHNPYQPIIKFIYDITEPVMSPFRRLLPTAGPIDFSPFLAVLVVTLIQRIVIQLLYYIY